MRPLEIEDFENEDAKAETFIQFTQLNKLLEKIVEFQDRKAEAPHEQVRTAYSGNYKRYYASRTMCSLRKAPQNGNLLIRRPYAGIMDSRLFGTLDCESSR